MTDNKNCADRLLRCLPFFQKALYGSGLLLVMTLSTLTAHATASDKQSHQQALTQARAGEHEAALVTLKSLAERHPDQPLYLHDYIAVLGWAERDTEALNFLPRLDLGAAPNYVLETLGKSARNQKQFPLSINIYRTAVHNNPRRIQSTLGLALSLADNGDVEEASGMLTKLLQQYPSHSGILNTQAYVYTKQKAFFKALKAYEQVLETSPENREARRGRILVTARLGAPHLAAVMAEQAPGLLSTAELDAIHRDRTAITIRWGRLPEKSDAPSYKDTDLAITSLENKLQQLQAAEAPRARAIRRLRYDLIEAFYDRQRYADVISVYENIDTATDPIPRYALTAVAGAYLQLREPEKSQVLLRQVLQQHPNDFDTKLTLVYAYVDSEKFGEAQTLISQMAQKAPPWLGGKDGSPQRENPHKLQADVTAALVEAFADNLDGAQSRLEDLLGKAPNNPGLRTELAYIYLWRGLPEQALREFRIALNAQPGHLTARLGKTAALLDLVEFRRSHESLQSLETQYPHRPGIRRLQRTWEIHNMRELRLTTGYGKSSGVQEGSEDFNLDAWLFSQPLKYRYRPFLYTHFATAKFPEGNAEYRRIGGGLEYRKRNIELISMLTRDDDDRSVNAGLSLNGFWRPTDHWRLGTGYDSNSNDIPLRGRLNEGVEGWSVNLDASYYFNESRRIDTSLKYLDFSDGNIRQSAQATLFQRLITKPHYKLDGTAGIYSSTNTRDNASYFNPSKDLSFDITLINEWLQFRHYDRSFRHRLGLSLGSYYQQRFGAKPTGLIFYEQQWNPDDTFEINYGISHARRAYDGKPENKTRLYLALNWRF